MISIAGIRAWPIDMLILKYAFDVLKRFPEDRNTPISSAIALSSHETQRR